MASQNSGRKRQHRSKTAIHKVSQAENQKIREHSSQQQRQQLSQTLHKHPHYHQIQQQKQQHEQQQQLHKQHISSTMTSSEGMAEISVSETSAQTLTSNIAGALDCCSNGKSDVTPQKSNITDLHAAVFCRRHDIVDTLLKKGAKPLETDQQGNTAFMLACKVGDIYLMTRLWEAVGSNMDANLSNKEGETALHLCAASGHEEGCRFLVSRDIEVHTKNNTGDTPLHVAAKGDHINVCQTLLKLDSSPKCHTHDLYRHILEENDNEQTALCVSITHHHAQVTRLLLDCLQAQQQINYLTSRLRKCATHSQSFNFGNTGSIDQGCQEVFLHGLLVSISVLLIRLSERRRRDNVQLSCDDSRHEKYLTNTDVIQSLIMIACHPHVNQQIIPVACFLLVYLMEGFSERHDSHVVKETTTATLCISEDNTPVPNKIPLTGVTFLEQFLQCRGPDHLLHRLNSIEVSDPSKAIVSIATATPVVFLVRSLTGRSWLETNRRHLTFLKELLIQNSSVFALLTSTCPLLNQTCLESTCKAFVRFVEVLDARDREQNLAELIWEEERDRMKRERKKHKRHQRKQQIGKQLNKDAALFPINVADVSSEDEASASLNDKVTSNDEETNDLWKGHVRMGSEHADKFVGKSNSMQEFLNRTLHENIPNEFKDKFASDESGDEAMKKRNDSNMNVKSKDFPPISIDPPLQTIKGEMAGMEEKKEVNRETDNEEMSVYDNFPSHNIGAIPKVMRWADVAKIGCNDKGLDGQDDQNSLSRITPDSVSASGWLRSNSPKKSGIETTEIDVEFVNSSGRDIIEGTAIDNTWYNVPNPTDIGDINSDDESSPSSSSSIESRSSLVSDSFLQTRKLNWMSEKVHLDIDMADDGTNEKKTAMTPCSDSFSCKRMKKRKTSQGCKRDNSCSFDSCWGTPDVSKQSAIRLSPDVTLDEEKMNNTSFKLPGVGSPLLRTRSDDILNDSSWFLAEKHWPSGSNKGLSNVIKPRVSVTNSLQRIEIAPPTFRTDTPTALPPLKFKELQCATGSTGVHDNSLLDHMYEMSKVETQVAVRERQKVLGKTACNNVNKQSFCVRDTPLSSITTGVPFNTLIVHKNTSSFTGTQSTSGCPKIRAPWTYLSTHIPLSSLSQRPLSTPSLSEQKTANTTTLSECPTLKNIDTSEAAINIQDSMEITENNKINHDAKPKIPGTSTKGRVITTVLLDKVKNPPISLQQNKVPSLSTLAWNCGEESNQGWSKSLPSKNTKNVTHSDATSETHNTSGDRDLNPKVTKCSNSIDYESSAECNIANPSSLCLPSPYAGIPMYLTETPTFSTILMNRMQQRRHNIGSYNFNSKGITASWKANEGVNVFSTPLFGSKDEKSRQHKANGERTKTTEVNDSDEPQHNHSNESQQHDVQHVHQSDSTRRSQKQEDCLTEARSERKPYDLDSANTQKEQRSWHQPDSGSTSPPVFFPDRIRDDVSPAIGSEAPFPGFHDVQTSDFLSEMFSDPLFSDKIAISQIRQKILSCHIKQSFHSDFSSQTPVANDIDLDYYASLYQMKFRDVLGRLPEQDQLSLVSGRESVSMNGKKIQTSTTHKERNVWKNNNQLFGVTALPLNHLDIPTSRIHSSRWRPSLQKILDLPWTMRRQYGDIVLPHSVPEYSIGMAGNVLISLGFLMDGTEVAVLIVDKTRAHIIPRMIEIMSDPEIDKHFLTWCKSYSESSNIQYIATALHEYSLCEYLQMCLPTCNQNSAVIMQLVWQLLQAVSFLHHGLGVPHGCLAPYWVFIDIEGHLRLAGFGITTSFGEEDKPKSQNTVDLQGYENQSSCWITNDDSINEQAKPNFSNDIQATGILAYFILTRGQHQSRSVPIETELNLMRDRVGFEAFDLIAPMLATDPRSRPTIDQCLKHPTFWSGDKKFRLILIVGSDVLTEMKTGVALTGSGAPTMMEILSLVDINMVSPNWIHEVDGTLLKEMRSFRVYKNNLAELTLFVYNCCLHFDKLSNVAKEVLDDPCKYFQNLFPSLFIAIYRSLKASDRIDRTCYKPFF